MIWCHQWQFFKTTKSLFRTFMIYYYDKLCNFYHLNSNINIHTYIYFFFFLKIIPIQYFKYLSKLFYALFWIFEYKKKLLGAPVANNKNENKRSTNSWASRQIIIWFIVKNYRNLFYIFLNVLPPILYKIFPVH